MAILPPDFFDDFDSEDGGGAENPYRPTLTGAIYARLAADELLTGLIASYDPLGAAIVVPAIFTDPIPEDAAAPFVVLSGEISQSPFLEDNDEDTERGREVLYQVSCYAPQEGSRALVERIAERIHAALHRKPLLIIGINHLLTSVSGPTRNDAVDMNGSALTARILLSE